MTTADESVQALIADVRHGGPNARLAALRGLGKMGAVTRVALPELTTALNDADGRVREAAAQAIGQVGRDGLGTLVRMLTHPDKYVRRHAVWGLGKVGAAAKPAMNDLCRALKDEDARTASGAAQALGVGEAAREPAGARRGIARTDDANAHPVE